MKKARADGLAPYEQPHERGEQQMTRTARTGRIMAAVAVCATTATALSAGTASAAATTVYTEHAKHSASGPPSGTACVSALTAGSTAGTVCFQRYGDVFWLKDTKADGHHVEMRATINSTSDGFRCWEDGGQAAGWQKCTSFAPHIPEKSTDVIAYSVNIMEGSTYLNTVVQLQPTN